MANTPYHKLPDNSYMNIASNGGPCIWKVFFSESDNNWYAQFTYDGITWIRYPTPFANIAAAQTALDNVITQINAGTFT